VAGYDQQGGWWREMNRFHMNYFEKASIVPNLRAEFLSNMPRRYFGA
jgi:hypothetical protein